MYEKKIMFSYEEARSAKFMSLRMEPTLLLHSASPVCVCMCVCLCVCMCERE